MTYWIGDKWGPARVKATCERLFPGQAHEAKVLKCLEEIKELRDCLWVSDPEHFNKAQAAEELADVLVTFANLGVDWEAALRWKMQVLSGRKWIQKTDGTYQHYVKADCENGPKPSFEIEE